MGYYITVWGHMAHNRSHWVGKLIWSRPNNWDWTTSNYTWDSHSVGSIILILYIIDECYQSLEYSSTRDIDILIMTILDTVPKLIIIICNNNKKLCTRVVLDYACSKYYRQNPGILKGATVTFVSQCDAQACHINTVSIINSSF